jgi:hypothetical protein
MGYHPAIFWQAVSKAISHFTFYMHTHKKWFRPLRGGKSAVLVIPAYAGATKPAEWQGYYLFDVK